MTNRRRGETAVEFGAKRYTLCLTLGALAERREIGDAEGVLELGERFAGGRLSARDLAALMQAFPD